MFWRFGAALRPQTASQSSTPFPRIAGEGLGMGALLNGAL